MTVAQRIGIRIADMRDGTTFKYQELGIAPSEYSAATKAIERLRKKGVVDRASTGVFYKPKKTVFGDLKPAQDELVKPYLYENNKRIAYVTGTSLYNRMGLTTQVPKNLSVASRDRRIITRIGDMQIRPVKSYVDVTKDNYQYLEILDAIKDIKIIPDSNIGTSILIICNGLQSLPEPSKLVKLALKYPPRVRALVGAMLEKVGLGKLTSALQSSINPLSSFKYGIDEDLLPLANKWKIS